MDEEKTYLTMAQAARVKGVSRQWIFQLVNDGRLDAERIGGRWMIPEDALGRIAPSARQAGRPRKPELMPEGYLNAREVAERIGVGYRRVVTLIALGRLPATKVGRQWAIRETDLESVKNLKRGDLKRSKE